MTRLLSISGISFLLLATAACAADTDLLKDIQAVTKEGAGSAAARAAWDRLVAKGPAALPDVLRAMDTPDTVVANWLHTAFDRIADTALENKGKGLDADVLLTFVQESKRQGRARRVALELVERLRPGTTARLIPGWLNDPEFRFEAVAAALKDAEAVGKNGDKEKTISAYRRALESTRDLQQVREAAAALGKLGVTISVAAHLGFLTDWHLIGPFDAPDMKGFKTVYPPEEKVDLAAEYAGQKGKVRWKRLAFREPPPGAGGHAALINLADASALGNADDAVAYAYTEFSVPQAIEAEFRGAADDCFVVWVNGKKAFAFEEYRNGVRLDRHRFRVKLQAGVNTVLVKVVQAPVDTANPAGNWEFMLRVVDDTGKGIAMKTALSEPKKD